MGPMKYFDQYEQSMNMGTTNVHTYNGQFSGTSQYIHMYKFPIWYFKTNFGPPHIFLMEKRKKLKF